jgi:gas vesicle protein
MASGKNFSLIGFFIGLAAGSIAGLLYAPKSGRELRADLKKELAGLIKKAEERKNQLVNKAKNISADLTIKGEQLINSAKNFADGKYKAPIESIEKEISNLKYAVNTAVRTYKDSANKKPVEQEVDDLFIDFEDETLPKYMGMKKRFR